MRGAPTDPFLKRINGTTLRDLYGPNFASLTVHDLMHMTSGLDRYSDSWVHNYTMNDPHWDLGPLDYLALLHANNETTVSCKCPTPPPVAPMQPCKRLPACCAPSGSTPNSGVDPEHCPDYNSINYMLLGLLYAAQTGAASWEDVDLKRAALGSESAMSAYEDTEFYVHGECSTYPRTVHYYDWYVTQCEEMSAEHRL